MYICQNLLLARSGLWAMIVMEANDEDLGNINHSSEFASYWSNSFSI